MISITRTPNSSKEFKAVFELNNKRKRTVRFGTSSNFALNHQKSEDDRKNYIRRHTVNENFDDPLSAGSLSRYILWEGRDWRANVRAFKRRFNL